ncbi:hypothetical protein N7509_009422 [Penicillium cosmopolitanum]|uniref:Uncharacterized protein n=1 Tax=Penicillium cosmopolitanum TaxID=1131564 RepID=A0A9W9VPD8_9EURO|nr:uncharacterized protein N7509_009422 [Penicillium cosmopolitanum]KAJ5386881.1 hypothetical protein N7509_009422 [Penicillium cosmopolitanum]
MVPPKNAKNSSGPGFKSTRSGSGAKAPSQKSSPRANSLQQHLNEWVQKTKKLEETLNTERKIRENERKENTRNYEKVQSLLCEKGQLNSQLAKMREGILGERAATAKKYREAQETFEKRQEERTKAEALRHQFALDRSSQWEIELKNEVHNLRGNNAALKLEREELRDRIAEQKRELDILRDQITGYRRERDILRDRIAQHQREQDTRPVEISNPIPKLENIPINLFDLENTWIKAEQLSDGEFDSPMPDIVDFQALHNKSFHYTHDDDLVDPERTLI